MATALDAFFVSLSLDPKLFEEGVAKVVQDLEKLKTESNNTANAMKSSGEEAAEFYTGLLANATKLFALFTMGTGIKDFVVDSIKAKSELFKFASSLKVNIESVQAWGRAVKNEGGSAEGFQSSLQGMVEKLGVVGTSVRGAKMAEMALGLAGISKEMVKGKDAFSVFEMLSNKLKKIGDTDPGRAFKVGKMLGLDTGTIRLLMKGGEEVNKLVKAQKELGVFSLDSAEAADKLNNSWTDAQTGMKKAVGFIAKEAVPVLQKMVDGVRKFSDWAREHQDIIKSAFAGISVALLLFGAAALKATVMAIGITGPLALIAAAVVGVSAAITYLILKWKEWNDAGAETNSLLGNIAAYYGSILDMIISAWDILKAFFTGDDAAMSLAMKNLTTALINVWISFENAAMMAWAHIKAMFDSEAEVKPFGLDVPKPEDMQRKPGEFSSGQQWLDTIFGTGITSIFKHAEQIPIATASGKSIIVHAQDLNVYTQATDTKGMLRDLELGLGSAEGLTA